jgi:hypothetical protein
MLGFFEYWSGEGMLVKVRQSEFSIGVSGTAQNELLTHNLWSCTGLAGTSKQGISFLCHFDGADSTQSVAQLVAKLEGKGVSDFSDFELRIVTGWAGFFMTWYVRIVLRSHLKKLGVFRTIPKTEYLSPWFLPWRQGGVRVNAEERTVKSCQYDTRVEYDRYTSKNPLGQLAYTEAVEPETPEELKVTNWK